MVEFFCSNCGASLHANLESSKLVDCEYCDTTQFIEDDGVRSLGARGVMLNAPALIEVGQQFYITGVSYLALGMVRYDYGAGTWDEFYCFSKNKPYWVSIDEGDVAVEQHLDVTHLNKITELFTNKKFPPKTFKFKDELFSLEEYNQAKCVAIRGELPEVVTVGDTHHFYDYGNSLGQIITYETQDNEQSVYYGYWCDPFDIRTDIKLKSNTETM